MRMSIPPAVVAALGLVLAPIRAILTLDHYPPASDEARVRAAGLRTHGFRVLPMLAVHGPAAAVAGLLRMAGLRSIYLDRQVDYLLDDSVAFIGADRVRNGLGFTGANVGIAVIDSGVDALRRRCTTDQGVRDTAVRCEPGSLLAQFSSRGIAGDPLYHPTITAPGVWIVSARASTGATINVLSTDLNTYCQPGDPAYYTCANGTSMATPHVSGVVALMLEANPALTPDQIKQILTTTAVPMARPDGALYQPWEVGAGYVDAYAAVQQAAQRAAWQTAPQATRLAAGTGQPAATIAAAGRPSSVR